MQNPVIVWRKGDTAVPYVFERLDNAMHCGWVAPENIWVGCWDQKTRTYLWDTLESRRKAYDATKAALTPAPVPVPDPRLDNLEAQLNRLDAMFITADDRVARGMLKLEGEIGRKSDVQSSDILLLRDRVAKLEEELVALRNPALGVAGKTPQDKAPHFEHVMSPCYCQLKAPHFHWKQRLGPIQCVKDCLYKADPAGHICCTLK